jgi:hypothetical protein
MTKRVTAEELASDLICNIETDKELNTLWSEMHAGIVSILKDMLRDDRKATLEAAAERLKAKGQPHIGSSEMITIDEAIVIIRRDEED